MYYVRLLFTFRRFTAENKTLKSSLTITRIKSGLKPVLRRLILPPSSGSMGKIMSHWHPIIHLGESIRRLFKIHKQAQLRRADAISPDTLLERHTSNSKNTIKMDLSPKRPDRLCGLFSLLFKGRRNSFTGTKRPARGADHSPTSTAEVTNEWSYTPSPPLRLHDADRGNRTFTFTFTCFCSWLSG
jgi:hypothetical protein